MAINIIEYNRSYKEELIKFILSIGSVSIEK